ncbi:Cell division cycle protein 16-like [Acipenser ruthenus]|uniref:Cell division cycle protein 16-like n=1 Tax=Acipenser ruthenus TaxID=7906 RepID=A0A444UFC1_ACIRT|nr:Cell division cycle protein 16-like [Acipenser ruthenus]
MNLERLRKRVRQYIDQFHLACQYLAARCHYAAKEYQQALDILDMEEPINKRLLDKSTKEDNGIKDYTKDWGMSTSSYNKPSETVVTDTIDGLQENLDVVVSLAERHYYNCDFKMCYKLTSTCSFAQVSWFAVGCYYLMVGHKNEHARRYLRYINAPTIYYFKFVPLKCCLISRAFLFSKATTLERTYGPAWIAYGHSFAVESEHDQAMAAYFTAAQLMKGCHLPMLYIGLEYGLTNNSKLAERFFSQALSIAPEDPFVMHEVGVVAFQNGEKYDQALEYHRQALVLIPQHASTYSAIGYVYSLMGDFESAIDYFHTALGLRRDDTFSVTMLGHCIEMYIGDADAYIGTDIKDKLQNTQSTPALMKMLTNPVDANELRTQPLEESGIMALETSPNPEKSIEAAPRLNETLEFEMYESDMMLETSMSDTST